MKSRYILSAILGLGLSSQVWSQPAPAKAPAAVPAPAKSAAPAATPALTPTAPPVLKPTNSTKVNDGERFIFIGDSITHQCRYTQFVEDFFFTRYPQRRIHFRNSGISGDRVNSVLERWDYDVADFKPTLATIMLGMNDGSYQDFNVEAFETYKKGMLEIMDRLDAMKCRVIVMSPTMFDHQAFAQMVAADPAKSKGKVPTNYNALMAFYGKWLQEVARERGYAFVDLFGPLNQFTVAERAKEPGFTLIPDAIHPEADGSLIMAYTLLKSMGELGPIGLSGARMNGKNWEPLQLKGKGDTKDLKVLDSRTISYTAVPQSLPWAVFEKAPLGSKLLNLASSATADFYSVDRLPMGKYEVWINDQLVETVGARALAGRLNFANDPESPSYQQALKVTTLNAKRNQEAVNPLRGLMASHRNKLRTKADQPEAFAQWEKTYLEQRAKYEALSQKYVDEIYQANQVKPLKVVIKPSPKKGA